jgi:hypothetical protein
MTGPDQPSLAERARTVVWLSTAATMITGRCGSRAMTVVSVRDRGDGCPVVSLDESSPVLRSLTACPVATLSYPSELPYPAFGLTGLLDRPRGVAPSGHSRRDLVLSPLSARFYGTDSVLVPMSEYLEASPDPLARHAAGTVRHLEGCHGPTVLDAVRRHRPHALAAVPRSLTRFGLEIGVLSADGVENLCLPFPGGPVSDVHEASAALRRLLTGTPSGVTRDREKER